MEVLFRALLPWELRWKWTQEHHNTRERSWVTSQTILQYTAYCGKRWTVCASRPGFSRDQQNASSSLSYRARNSRLSWYVYYCRGLCRLPYIASDERLEICTNVSKTVHVRIERARSGARAVRTPWCACVACRTSRRDVPYGDSNTPAHPLYPRQSRNLRICTGRCWILCFLLVTSLYWSRKSRRCDLFRGPDE